MISIARSLARRLRAVFRRAGLHKVNDGGRVLFAAGTEGLIVQAASPEVMIEYREAGSFAPESLVVPLQLLEDCEGPKDDPVTLEASGKSKVTAAWTDGRIPQLVSVDAGKAADVPVFPAMPTDCATNEPGLWQALRQAAAVADREAVRYALNCLQLQGTSGKINATDGRQVLVQSGYKFPWQDDVLIPASPLFNSRELPESQAVRVGRSGEWVMLELQPWRIAFKLHDGRYPKIEQIVSDREKARTRVMLSPSDAQFLAHSLERLPCCDEQYRPVTLDVNGRICVRGRSEAVKTPTELVLTNSRFEGEAVTINTDRRYLEHALKLGFTAFYFTSPESPALCDDGRKQFLWALLTPGDAIKSSDDAVRIESPIVGNSQVPISPPRRHTPVSQPKTETREPEPVAGSVSTQTSKPRRQLPANPASPIEQAVALRTALREAASQANELIRNLKREKRKSKLLQSSLAALKELQRVAA